MTVYHELGGREYEKLLGLHKFGCRDIVEQNHGLAIMIMKYVLHKSFLCLYASNGLTFAPFSLPLMHDSVTFAFFLCALVYISM